MEKVTRKHVEEIISICSEIVKLHVKLADVFVQTGVEYDSPVQKMLAMHGLELTQLSIASVESFQMLKQLGLLTTEEVGDEVGWLEKLHNLKPN